MDKKTVRKIEKLTKKRFYLEMKGTIHLGRAMKLNRAAYKDNLMTRENYLQTRKNYLQEFQKLLDQEMPVD